MHPSALEYGKKFFETYCKEMPNGTVIDIGAQNVNGSLKDVCPEQLTYIGVDFVEGKGVDVILTDPYHLPFDDESADIIVSSSCFEHSEFFWLVFNEMLRVLKPDGLLYLNAPSNGYIHRYPVDCWRFYPDAGMALVNWAKRCGMQPALLESFTGHKFSNEVEGEWNDFVCIFIKDQKFISNHSKRIIQNIENFDNALMNNDVNLIKAEFYPQDIRNQNYLKNEVFTIGEQNNSLKNKVFTISEQNNSLKNEVFTISEQNKKALIDLEEMKNQNLVVEQEKQKQLDILSNHIENLERAINDIYRSSSWRITRPLRYFGRIWRKLIKYYI